MEGQRKNEESALGGKPNTTTEEKTVENGD